MKAVNATCNTHRAEIILEYQAMTIILQTSPSSGCSKHFQG